MATPRQPSGGASSTSYRKRRTRFQRLGPRAGGGLQYRRSKTNWVLDSLQK